MGFGAQRTRLGRIALTLLLVAARSTSHAGEGDLRRHIPEGLVLFPNIAARATFDGDSDTDLTPAIDLFYSHDFNRLRVLGELFLNRREQELERLQIGWLINTDLTVWGGRFHTPLGYWNTAYHHGTHLQTTVTRPGIVEFEDRGGAIPLHLAGGLLQGRKSIGTAEIAYELAIGAGPEMSDDGLEPFDVLEPSQNDHGFSYAANLSIKPLTNQDRQAGAFFGRFELPSRASSVREADLLVAGAWGLWQHDSLRALAAGFYIHDRIDRATATSSASFASGYLQGEWQLDRAWTFYGRIEQSSGTSGDAYLALFPNLAKRTYLGGVRLNLNSRHSLRIEFADRDRFASDFKEVLFQWTAALP